ncbi:hypothetical protein FACS189451_09350 [Bacteroidia bacterium]|nr:hypothetical protein FACS189451_09350 [Bacteroidia bacterium]
MREKMKKMLFLMLFLLILGAASVSSQVRIGGNGAPNAAAVLDLNANDDASPSANKGALALPRVNLTSETMQLNGATPANGMLIYNTGTTFPVGVYVWITNKWLKADAANPLKITAQPKSFTWYRKQDATADPNGPPTVTATALSVTATGSGTLTYAWYEKPKNVNITDRGTKLSDAASYTPPVTDWGMHTYYCVVSNGTDSVVSNYADVAIGCGAKTTDGRWLSFMCYNLGADTSLDPFAWGSSTTDTTSADIKGWLFQWGRVADGHQWRSSATQAGPVYLPTQDQVPASGTSGTSASLGIAAAQTYANYNGKFITSSGYEYFHDWRTPQIGWLWYSLRSANDPCPTGWQLPTQSDFATIISDNAFARQAPSDATANTWSLTTNGFQIRPDGSTATLFLPAAGVRGSHGAFDYVGSNGHYWSSTASASGAFYLSFSSGVLTPSGAHNRASGRSVRCVQNH